jgi:hypothetical protein
VTYQIYDHRTESTMRGGEEFMRNCCRKEQEVW